MTKKKGKPRQSLRTVLFRLLLAGVIIFLVYLYFGGKYGLWQHWKQHEKKQALLQEIDQLRAEQDSLKIVVESLRSDSSYMAKVAREKYDMGRPDEELLRVVRKEKE